MSRNPLRACWDYPQEQAAAVFGSPVARDGRLPLVGWALADEPPVIHVAVDGRRLASVTPTFPREDIEIIYGHAYAAAAGVTGWATSIDAASIDEGWHEVAVAAEAQGHTIDLGTRLLSFALPGERGDASLERLRPLLRSDDYRAHAHQALFSSAPGEWVRHATSVFGFSMHARAIVHGGGTVLVVGAGIAPTVDNAFQLDIFDYPNVDVVSDRPELPFVDACFDGVVCENVIEHVPDPFALVGEIERVLKPGGRLGLNGTNLHFTHGFPSHFFNATEFGMRYMLEDRARFEGRYEFMPIKDSLGTILRYYLNALTPEARAKIGRMRVDDLFKALGADTDADRWITGLPPKAQRALSTNIYFVGRKRT